MVSQQLEDNQEVKDLKALMVLETTPLMSGSPSPKRNLIRMISQNLGPIGPSPPSMYSGSIQAPSEVSKTNQNRNSDSMIDCQGTKTDSILSANFNADSPMEYTNRLMNHSGANLIDDSPVLQLNMRMLKDKSPFAIYQSETGDTVSHPYTQGLSGYLSQEIKPKMDT